MSETEPGCPGRCHLRCGSWCKCSLLSRGAFLRDGRVVKGAALPTNALSGTATRTKSGVCLHGTTDNEPGGGGQTPLIQRYLGKRLYYL